MSESGLWKIFWRTSSPFCGVADTPVLDFWWRLPWVSKPERIPNLCASVPAHNGFLRFTCGATPANLWRVSIDPHTCACFNKHWWDSDLRSSVRHSFSHSGFASDSLPLVQWSLLLNALKIFHRYFFAIGCEEIPCDFTDTQPHTYRKK